MMKYTKLEYIEKFFIIYIKLFLLVATLILAFFLVPACYAYSYDTVYGDEILENTVNNIVGNETDPDKVALLIMNWEKEYFLNPYSNYDPDSKLQEFNIYDIDGYHLFIRPAPSSWIIHSKMANCGEYAKVFVALMNEAGHDARFISSSGGDHCWAEYSHRGYKVAVDPSSNYVIGSNLRDFENKMGTSFQYIESSDLEGNSYAITHEYINTSNLTVFVSKRDVPVSNAEVIIYSSYLKEQKGGRYDEVVKITSAYTDVNGYCYFDLGYQNYTIEVEDEWLLFLNRQYKENFTANQELANQVVMNLDAIESKIII